MATPALLAIETATDVCSVALAQDDRVTVELSLSQPRRHAESLAPLIDDALRYGRLAAADLDVIAVSAGPGSYTGLRIGVSTAKGLAMAVGARLVGVPSLDALATAAAPAARSGDVVAAFFPSRRHEVYAAAFTVDADRHLVPLRPASALAGTEVAGWLDAAPGTTVWLAGEGSARVTEPLGAEASLDVRVLDASEAAPSAARVARLGLARAAAEVWEDLSAFEPAYLKAFVAKTPTASAFDKLSF